MQKVKNKNISRWYGTPCNIDKDERILNYDYYYALKKLKIKTIFPQKVSLKFYKRDGKGSNPRPTDCNSTLQSTELRG